MTYPNEPNVNRRPPIDDPLRKDSTMWIAGSGAVALVLGLVLFAITRNTDTAMNERPAPTATTSPATTSGSGACSKIRWALVPEMPNDETAARRGWPFCSHVSPSCRSDTAPADQSTCGVGSSICKVFGKTPCCIAITIVITPATPAAAALCPMFDLIDPSRNGPFSRPWP